MAYALAIPPVNYHDSVFIPFSVNNGNGGEMTAGLSCAASLSPGCHHEGGFE